MFWKRQKLTDVFPDWMDGGGIFHALQSYDVPWKSANIDDVLDLEFFGDLAGDRFISPLIRKMKELEELTAEEIGKLAKVAFTLYGVSWVKEYATLSAQYDPIENYSMREQMTNDTTATLYGKSQTRTDNLSHTKTGTETQTPNTTDTRTDNTSHAKTGTDTLTHNTTDTRTDDLTHTKTGDETTEYDTTETQTPAVTQATNVYGFNSSTAVPAGTQVSSGTNTTEKTGTDTLTHDVTETETGTVTNAKTGTEQQGYNSTETDTGTVTEVRTGTDTMQYNTTDANTGTQTVADSGTDMTTRNYVLTRSGNIGVTTSQQMLESERALWLWNYFTDIVFPDMVKLLTLPIY